MNAHLTADQAIELLIKQPDSYNSKIVPMDDDVTWIAADEAQLRTFDEASSSLSRRCLRGRFVHSKMLPSFRESGDLLCSD